MPLYALFVVVAIHICGFCSGFSYIFSGTHIPFASPAVSSMAYVEFAIRCQRAANMLRHKLLLNLLFDRY